MSFNNLDFKSRQGTPLHRFETEQGAIRGGWEMLAEGKESRRALRVRAQTTRWCLTTGENGASLRGNRVQAELGRILNALGQPVCTAELEVKVQL